MSDERVIKEAHACLDGMSVLTPYGDDWLYLTEACAMEILRDWKRREGSERFTSLVDQMAAGHVVESPHVPGFRYRAGSPVGRQEPLF